MIGYLSYMKDNGKRCWIRADEVAAFSENETKVDGKLTACLTILLRNNVSWHIPELSGADLLLMLRGVTGDQVQELRDNPNGGLP